MTKLLTLFVSILVLLAVSACDMGGAATPAAGTPTLAALPARATLPAGAPATAAPPTGMPTTAPRGTPVPLSASATKIKSAIEQSKTVTRARFSMIFVTGETQNGQYNETPYMDAKGELDGALNSFVFKGGVLNQAFGNVDTVEMISDGQGKTFVRGAQLTPGMDPQQWYYTDSGATEPPLTVNDVLDFTDTDIDWQTARDGGSETLDGQTCAIHAWNPSEGTVADMVRDADNKDAFNVVDKAEYRVAICPDGFVHHVTMELLGHAKADANNKGGLRMELRLSDINATNIKITIPADAKPLIQ